MSQAESIKQIDEAKCQSELNYPIFRSIRAKHAYAAFSTAPTRWSMLLCSRDKLKIASTVTLLKGGNYFGNSEKSWRHLLPWMNWNSFESPPISTRWLCALMWRLRSTLTSYAKLESWCWFEMEKAVPLIRYVSLCIRAIVFLYQFMLRSALRWWANSV